MYICLYYSICVRIYMIGVCTKLTIALAYSGDEPGAGRRRGGIWERDYLTPTSAANWSCEPDPIFP